MSYAKNLFIILEEKIAIFEIARTIAATGKLEIKDGAIVCPGQALPSGKEVKPERRAPVQRYHGKTIPWRVHGLAWEGYAKQFGTSQSADRLAVRGGFGIGEMDRFLPGWRDMANAIDNPAPTPDAALLLKALRQISLCAQNSASSREEMGRIAREAAAALTPPQADKARGEATWVDLKWGQFGASWHSSDPSGNMPEGRYYYTTPQPQGDASPCPECQCVTGDVGPVSESDFATPQVSGGRETIEALAAIRRAAARTPHREDRLALYAAHAALSPPAEQVSGELPDAATLRLHLGELTADEVRVAQAAIRYALSQRPVATCAWVSDENGPWMSACGQAWEFMDGGPEDNSYRFCHGCGKPILATTTTGATP